ncbi:hypothetical protein A3731_22360 [Roseovarius sp. HI0049]|nr:hypothetical protein A3731_22360 [Roseovarius sp. HI0049]
MPDIHENAQSGETTIVRLFRLTHVLRQAAEDHEETWEDIDAELYKLFYRQVYRIENEILRLPATTAADMAAKFLVLHGINGGYYIEDGSHFFFAEARALTGVEPIDVASQRQTGIAA